MYEPVNNSTPNIKNYNSQSSFGQVNSFKAAQLSSTTETGPREESNKSGAGMPSRATPGRLKKDRAGLHNTGVQFSVHEETGKTMIKIIDRENNEVIREIPSKEDLERSAQLRTYVGHLFDAIA